MSACGESHDADVVPADLPACCIYADQSHCLFGIRYGDFGVAVRHTVLQHDGRNALVLEELSPVVAFFLHRQRLIGTARTDDYGTSRGLFLHRQEDAHLGSVS